MSPLVRGASRDVAREAPLAWDEAVASIVRRHRPGRALVGVRRAPMEYGSSWWLERVGLDLDDGSALEVVFKDLGREVPGSGARRAKPRRALDPGREPWAYRAVLGPDRVGAPECLALVADDVRRRHWLFLERVRGAPLSEVGDGTAWRAAAEWLGGFHARVAAHVEQRGRALLHDPELHAWWLRRARAGARERAACPGPEGAVGRRQVELLRAIAPVHARITAELLARRPWLIHGELYASNVLLESAGAAIRPVDWEMIGIGPRLLDLAALTSGRLADAARESLIEAYRGALSDAGAPDPGDAPFRRELTACRLLLAVQWLGWGRGWRPPREHRHDWLDEAVRCARGLEGA